MQFKLDILVPSDFLEKIVIRGNKVDIAVVAIWLWAKKKLKNW